MIISYKQQVDFISYIQRLLNEGDFTSTYKFAFLHALADICIESKVVNQNAKLRITLDAIIEKFISLYWQHSLPFFNDSSSNDAPYILQQNQGKQAKIISDIVSLQLAGVRNVEQAKSSPQWKNVYRSTKKTLQEGPLWRLQILAKQEECFLFPHVRGVTHIELNEGIAQCFRQFHDIVVRFARQGWVDKISKITANQTVIGRAGELHDFLFGTSRLSLKSAHNLLTEIQKGNCFYCKKPLKSASEVDHFIPFSKYNIDLGHNFVLAHKSCNNNKRDHLAAPIHREGWEEQNLVVHAQLISEELSKSFVCDAGRSKRVAEWAYNHAEVTGGRYWLKTKDVFI